MPSDGGYWWGHAREKIGPNGGGYKRDRKRAKMARASRRRNRR